jgi:hypothetical protein
LELHSRLQELILELRRAFTSEILYSVIQNKIYKRIVTFQESGNCIRKRMKKKHSEFSVTEKKNNSAYSDNLLCHH